MSNFVRIRSLTLKSTMLIKKQCKSKKILHNHRALNHGWTDKTNISLATFRAYKKNSKQIVIHDWTRFISKLCELKLRTCSTVFWFEYYFSFLQLYQLCKTPPLHDLLDVQRLETTVKCTLHGDYFEPCLHYIRNCKESICF